jgi:hypothetical protein
MLSRFMAKPTYRACLAVTRLLHYLSRTPHNGLVYHGESLHMHAYSDSDWATCPVTRRSISGTVVFLCGAPVSWMSPAAADCCNILFGGRIHRGLLRSSGHCLVSRSAVRSRPSGSPQTNPFLHRQRVRPLTGSQSNTPRSLQTRAVNQLIDQ